MHINLNNLDNPAWHALNSYHLLFSICGDIAARYPADMFQVAVMRDTTISGLDDFQNFVSANETLFSVGAPPKNLDGWQVVNN